MSAVLRPQPPAAADIGQTGRSRGLGLWWEWSAAALCAMALVAALALGFVLDSSRDGLIGCAAAGCLRPSFGLLVPLVAFVGLFVGIGAARSGYRHGRAGMSVVLWLVFALQVGATATAILFGL